MHKEVNHKIRKHFNEGILQCARLYRNRAFYRHSDRDRAGWHPADLCDHRDFAYGHGHRFLYNISCKWVSLVVGVEFVKMLCRHSAQTVVEVLMFATARQMVVEHMKPSQTLIGVIAIAILFAIRKFLMTEDDDMAHAPVKKHADMNKDENIDEKE